MYFTPTQVLKFKKIKGFTYGPVTYTFNFLRRKVVKIAKKMQFTAYEIQEKWDRFRSKYNE